MESLYFGVPMLGFGQVDDQPELCVRMEHFGVGRVGRPIEPKTKIYKQIQEIISEDSLELANAKRAMKLLEFEERRKDKDMHYWIKYTIRFGTLHLINP